MLLITGGTGFIGSHAVVSFVEAGYDVVIVDNFSNSKPDILMKLETILEKPVEFAQGDISDPVFVRRVLSRYPIEAVIHFAGVKAVGESVSDPLKYYHNNVVGTINLCRAMQERGIKKMVFSSSATVYGVPVEIPIPEGHPTGAVNPYGRTKLMIEDMLRDLSESDPEWSVALLRYFNPVGAHSSGLLGEDPQGIPNNLMPYILRVAAGNYPFLSIFGNDYPTPDGTGVRDYVHVVDLAEGHVRALERVVAECGCHTFNLGTGKGTSVLSLVKSFETANGVMIPYRIVDRRSGDVDAYWADPTKANRELGWESKRDISDMCRDAWGAVQGHEVQKDTAL